MREKRHPAGRGIVRRFAALALAVLLAATLVPTRAQAASAYYPDRAHTALTYDAMPKDGIDLASVASALRRFEADPAGEYEALLSLSDELSTREALAEIESSIHGTDEALSDALEQTQSDYSRAMDMLSVSLERALNGPRGEELRAVMPDWAAEGFVGYEEMSEEEMARADRESELVQDYYLLPRDRDFHDAAAELYLSLTALRREEARAAGYESYAAYAYDTVYSRDFTPEEVETLRRLVKTRIAPLCLRCEEAAARTKPAWDTERVPETEELLDLLEEHLPHVSPELSEALSYLRQNGLYCIGQDEALLDMGYTLSLPYYGSAFLFNRVHYRLESIKSTIHEFGHFNAAYHDPTPSLYAFSNIDVNEVQSQGLEMLFLPCLQEILAGEDEEQRSLIELYVVGDMLSSVVDGFFYDEFEQAAFDHPDLDAAGLDALERRLLKEYGLDALYGSEVYWPEVGHLFEQPFYYISYAVSALSALDIWQLSLRDRDEAVDAYLRVSAADSAEWFLDVLDESGLQDVTDPACLESIARGVESHFGETLDASPWLALQRYAAPAAVAVVTLLVVLPLLRAARKGNRSEKIGAEPDEPDSAP